MSDESAATELKTVEGGATTLVVGGGGGSGDDGAAPPATTVAEAAAPPPALPSDAATEVVAVEHTAAAAESSAAPRDDAPGDAPADAPPPSKKYHIGVSMPHIDLPHLNKLKAKKAAKKSSIPRVLLPLSTAAGLDCTKTVWIGQ